MQQLILSDSLRIPLREISLHAIRSQGAGGQNVNKVATGIHLRFDIAASSLPEKVKQRLYRLTDQHLSISGIIVIKAQQSRSQEQNRLQALERLAQLIRAALHESKPRRKTRPTKSSGEKRLNRKAKTGQRKSLRRKVPLP